MDGAQLLMRLLCAAPFSAHDVRQQELMRQRPRGDHRFVAAMEPLPLCTAFDAFLDATTLPRYRMRPYANAWLSWSYKRIAELAGVFACAGNAGKRFMLCRLCIPAVGAAAVEAARAVDGAPALFEPTTAGCGVERGPGEDAEDDDRVTASDIDSTTD